METPFKELGKKIKELREKNGLKQKDFVKPMKVTTSQIVSNIERGCCIPCPKFIKVFLKLTNVRLIDEEIIDYIIEDQREKLILKVRKLKL